MATATGRGDKLITSPLNRLPEGLLDFFQIKAMGEYPGTMVPTVQPIMDLTRWYSDIQAAEGTFEATALAANTPDTGFPIPTWLGHDFGNGTFTSVPQNELWVVLEASCKWVMNNAGHVADFALMASLAQATAQRQIILTDGNLVGYGTGAAVTRSGLRRMAGNAPFFALPATIFSVYCAGALVPAGTITISVSMRAVRLKR